MPQTSTEARLAAPFAVDEVKFKPAVVNGNRALALAYVDARVIQDRLDEVLGVTGWQDEYEPLPNGSVVCRLRLKIGEEWITKMDVGSPSEQPDEGDRCKAAFSDALKRAAIKFGVGRYLYRLKSEWVDYDPKTKRLMKTPSVPPSKTGHPTHPPKTKGVEVAERFRRAEATIASEGKCQPGALWEKLQQALHAADWPLQPELWNDQAVAFAIEAGKRLLANAIQPSRSPVAGELIGPRERQEVARLLKEAGKTWRDVLTFLRIQTPNFTVNDLTMQQFETLKAGIQQVIEKQKKAS